jgi:hypothetical protein
MASRLTTTCKGSSPQSNQEIAGSTPAVVIDLLVVFCSHRSAQEEARTRPDRLGRVRGPGGSKRALIWLILLLQLSWNAFQRFL